ncbi:MAG: DNA ligase D [Candidatus Rokubacteria bacterium]|nr:DNA ligase D [Candidatus Rokubacteria bacterium]
MLAAPGEAPLVDDRLAYEPKYDGIRALVALVPGRGDATVRIWSRLGNDKTAQFPEIVASLARFARTLEASVVLDGEIVALDSTGEPAGFQRLQGRIHGGRADAARQPVTFIAFDIVRDGPDDLRALPLTARRARLERVYGSAGPGAFRLSAFAAGDGRELHRTVLARGGEGLIVKRLDSPYRSGRRSAEWTKVKLTGRQDCVVGGFTDPRQSRAYFGALLLGVYDGDAFEYIGHTGTGFTHAELARLARRMKPLETAACPFRTRPRTNERPQWIRPELVVDVKFSEWTRDGRLRAPVYLGVRDDVRPRDVRREAFVRREQVTGAAVDAAPPVDAPLAELVATLERLETERRDGVLTLPDGYRLEVANLAKVLWPGPRITKGALLRYYVRMSPWLLPNVADRPLVMKRFPNGIQAKAFYQQRAPDRVPPGVRVEVIDGDVEVPSRIVGGGLVTLLYMAQLAVISQDPWFSRADTPEHADHVAFDLDPMPGVGFARVLDVARWIRDELDRIGVPSVPKTSGAEGLHIYVPLPPRTSYESGRLFCQIVATLVAGRHPEIATVERAVHARGRTVYIDYLQNIRGKTLATAYSARASDFAGVSAPLTWDEVDAGVDRRDYTLHSMPARLAAIGDLWARLRTGPTADLGAVLRALPDPGGAARAVTSSRPPRRERSSRAAASTVAAKAPSGSTRSRPRTRARRPR